MMQASAYGRLGGDPREITTKSDTTMVVASIAVQIADGEAYWLGVVAFGRTGEDLARHAKGDPISVVGRVQLNRWADKSGEEREQLQIVADHIVSARSVRPGGGGQKRSSDRRQPRPAEAGTDFNDDIPFGTGDG